MTRQEFDALAPRARRRLMLRAVVRAFLTVGLLVVLYYALPMDHESDTATIVLLLVGLLVFAALVTWQVRAILRSDYPAVQAVQALAVAIPLFLLLPSVTLAKRLDVDGAHARGLNALSSDLSDALGAI